MSTLGASRPEQRAFGRMLSTNNGEANAQMSMLSIACDGKTKPNVSISHYHTISVSLQITPPLHMQVEGP